MKTINCFILIFFIIISSSCEIESPKGGSYLTKSSILGAEINLFKSVEHDGSISSFIGVTIRNTMGGTYQIKNGWVKVNDMEMNFTSTRQDDGTTHGAYQAGGIVNEVEPNKQYDFEIKLSDGTVYNSSIMTQETDLNELNVPAIHDRNSDMKISWKETHPTDSRQVDVFGYYENNHLFSSPLHTDESERTSGEFIIPKERFSDPKLDSVVIQIRSTKYGTQDPALYSEIMSLFRIKKSCKIN